MGRVHTARANLRTLFRSLLPSDLLLLRGMDGDESNEARSSRLFSLFLLIHSPGGALRNFNRET